MAEVIGIKFKNNSKTYYFDPVGETFSEGVLLDFFHFQKPLLIPYNCHLLIRYIS